MKIRALAQLSGPTISARPGDIVEVDELMGRGLIEAAAAVAVDPPLPASPAPEPESEPEAAALESPPEQATLRAARPRRVSATDEDAPGAP